MEFFGYCRENLLWTLVRHCSQIIESICKCATCSANALRRVGYAKLLISAHPKGLPHSESYQSVDWPGMMMRFPFWAQDSLQILPASHVG